VRWSIRRGNLGVAGLLVASLSAAFLVGRLVIWFHDPIFLNADSPTYRLVGHAHSVWYVLSFTGHSSRLWGAPLLFAVFSSDDARAFAQWTIGTLAWGLLAVVLCMRLRSTLTRVLTAAAVLGLGLLPQAASWDFAIIAEPLSIDLGVATLALLIWFLGGGGRPVLIALTITAFWWTFVRPELRVMVGFVIVVLIAYAVFRRSRRWAVAAAAAVLVLAAGWVTAITPTMDRTHADRLWHGLTLTEATFTYRLRFEVMANPKILAVYQNKLGLPHCPAAERFGNSAHWQMTAFLEAYLSCPDLVAWGRKNAGSSGYRFAIAAPDLYAHEMLRVLPLSLGSATIPDDYSVLPRPVERIAFPARHRVLPFLAIGWLVALAGALVTGAFRRRKLLVWTSVGVILASAASSTIELMYAAGDYSRFGIQEALLSRIAIILMAAAALDALIGRFRGETAPPADHNAGRADHDDHDGGGSGAEPAAGQTATTTLPVA
jgi:hypothetical protein